MEKKYQIFGIVLILSLFLFSGCTNSNYFTDDRTQAPEYLQELVLSEVSQVCSCLICEKGQHSASWPFSIFMSRSLFGGNCFFYDQCTSTTIEEIFSSDKTEFEPKPFMLGMGPRPWDFAYANPYCDNSLTMSVQWLLADNSRYEIPSKTQAACYLEKNVLPVYILYSNGKSIDLESTEEIANKLKGVGPAIIVAEIDFDSKDEDAVAKVSQQLIRLKQICGGTKHPTLDSIPSPALRSPECIVAIGPRMGDYEGLEKLLSDPAVDESVDMVAFGVNSHYLKSSTCTAQMLYYEAIQFSKFAWFEHSKPVLWPYMLFDKEGGNIDGSCQWSDYEINRAYYEFYSTVIPAAMLSGVVGAAPYQFYSAGVPTDPLDCENCGLVEISEGAIEPKEPLFSSWFYGCRNYIAEDNPIIITLPNEKGTVCNFGFTGGLFINPLVTTGLAQENYIATHDKAEMIFTCLECVDECYIEDCEKKGDPDCSKCSTEDLDPYDLKSAKISVGEKCEKFEELDLWASIRGLDPAFVRATAWAESGLDTQNPESSYCALSIVNRTNGWNNCNALDVLYIVDPRVQYEGEYSCTDYFESAYYSEIRRTNSNENPNDDKKPCSFGLMQINPDAWASYPYPYWSFEPFNWPLSELNSDNYAIDLNELKAIYTEGARERKIAESCAGGGLFNPFDGDHSACYGTWILKNAWNNAKNWVDKHTGESELNVQTELQKKWVTSFVAHYLYYGVPLENSPNSIASWLFHFESRKDLTDAGCSGTGSDAACCSNGKVVTNACCNNNDNFIKFVACCIDYPSRPADYPSQYCGNVPLKDRTSNILEEGKYGNLGFERLIKQYSLSTECEDKYLCGNTGLQKNNIDLFCMTNKLACACGESDLYCGEGLLCINGFCSYPPKD